MMPATFTWASSVAAAILLIEAVADRLRQESLGQQNSPAAADA